jgi:Rod binding domain-containing protein
VTLPVIGYHLFTQTAHIAKNPIFQERAMDTPIRPLTQQTSLPPPASLAPQDRALMEKAKALEASFLTEMLGHAGLGAAPQGFSGGIGEEQFSSFLRAEQAKAMVEKGGIGLAEQIFNSLKERAADAG